MADTAPHRFYFEGYALTYTKEGWALLHEQEGLVGTDRFPSAVKALQTRDGRDMMEFIQEVIEQDRGEAI